ncbi:MAG: aminoacyl-tRNA hydrolase [Pseudomonadota bacterium]
MLLLVGLGNPGDKYARHRHNVGFMAIDAVAGRHGFARFRSKFQGLLSEGVLPGAGKTLLLKPQTYMNDSGQSVGEAARFYKIPLSDIIVLHDELDLAPGKLKAKTGGGAAGHNGLKSITNHIDNDYRRVRIGIGHPGDKARVHAHVLGDFAKADAAWLEPLLDAIAVAAPALGDGDAAFSSEVGRLLKPQPPKERPKRESKDAPQDMVTQTRSAPALPASETDAPASPFADALKKLLPKK